MYIIDDRNIEQRVFPLPSFSWQGARIYVEFLYISQHT